MGPGYYLLQSLEPLGEWLSGQDITDIWINRPGEIWVERLGGGIECHRREALTEDHMATMARQIAAYSSQGINAAHPLLSAKLPDGSRVQIAAPPATRAGHAFAIRRHISSDFSLDDWAGANAFDGLEGTERSLEQDVKWRSLHSGEAVGFLREAVRSRKNILVVGGTSTGKTTFLNALLAEIPSSERLILIEDTEELRVNLENVVGLIAARGSLSEAEIEAEDLLIAALRMRPDRIILGELRGAEAFTFLRAVNTGHPGSMTTIHADTPQRAIEQLTLLVMLGSSRLQREDVRHYVRESIDVFVQLARRAGKRQVVEIWVKDKQP